MTPSNPKRIWRIVDSQMLGDPLLLLDDAGICQASGVRPAALRDLAFDLHADEVRSDYDLVSADARFSGAR